MNQELFNITMGNAAQFRLTLMRNGESFPVELSEDVQAFLVSSMGTRKALTAIVGEGNVVVTVPAMNVLGCHGIEIKGMLLGHGWRTFTGAIIKYTYDTVEGDETDKTITGEPYDITCEVGLYTAGDSASRLTTPRDIWGQPFDGTQDVSGAMTGVTSINGTIAFENNEPIVIGSLYFEDSTHEQRGRIYLDSNDILNIEEMTLKGTHFNVTNSLIFGSGASLYFGTKPYSITAVDNHLQIGRQGSNVTTVFSGDISLAGGSAKIMYHQASNSLHFLKSDGTVMPISAQTDWSLILNKPSWVNSNTKPSYTAQEVGAYSINEIDAKLHVYDLTTELEDVVNELKNDKPTYATCNGQIYLFTYLDDNTLKLHGYGVDSENRLLNVALYSQSTHVADDIEINSVNIAYQSDLKTFDIPLPLTLTDENFLDGENRRTLYTADVLTLFGVADFDEFVTEVVEKAENGYFAKIKGNYDYYGFDISAEGIATVEFIHYDHPIEGISDTVIVHGNVTSKYVLVVIEIYESRDIRAVFKSQELGVKYATVARSGSFADLSNVPTTIAGYGITDAKIENGTITLGSNTITPMALANTSSDFIKIESSKAVIKNDSGNVMVGIYSEDSSHDSEFLARGATGTYLVSADVLKRWFNGKQDTLTFDDTPAGNSNNPVKSSGIYSALSGKADKSEMSVSTSGDQTTITLKSGTSATVINAHQSLTGKQDVIDSSHKLSADLVDDTSSTNKFVTASDKQTWNGKQDAVVFNTAYDASTNKAATMADIPTVPTNVSAFTNDAGYLTAHQDISGKEDKLAIDSTAKTASFTAEVDKYYTVNVADNGSVAITLPTTGLSSSYAQKIVFLVTLGTGTASCSFSNVTKMADGFSLDADSVYEVNALWNGSGWYIAAIKMVVTT